ncbi:ADP-ribose glycohydrolase MACROD2 isoform X5 [Pyxicephalus adspersus]|uniref:ADP-ribose glycohydrolase MACROD2 isoform X5 n=1 Tax=Pyxicephalus adspersus TaxID=30357 RepID=UPI003B5C2D0A
MPNSNKKKRPWEEEKERLLKMSQEQRRQLIKEYISLHDVPTWLKQYGDTPAEDDNEKINSLCDKVSLYRGDITQLEVDAIVNAANSSLLGGGGDVIHTVGPIARGQLSDSHKKDLESCYKSSLALATKYKIRSIAFPCISTGIYGFPNEPAACIALNTAKEWLTENKDEVDRIIFCVFLEIDEKIYSKKLSEFFPKEVEEKNVHSPPSKKSKAKKADESTNIDDSDDMDKETGHESDDASEMKKPGHESDISDEMAGLGQEQEGSMRGTVLESAEGSGDMEKPHQHSEVPDGGPIKDDGGEQELSQASNLSQTDECMKEPTQEEVKTKPEDITPSQETGTDSQSESVYMDSQEPFSHTPLAKEPKVDSDSESQVMEQSIDTCDQAQSDIQDVEMNSQNTITPNDENSQLMGDSPDAREGDEK